MAMKSSLGVSRSVQIGPLDKMKSKRITYIHMCGQEYDDWAGGLHGGAGACGGQEPQSEHRGHRCAAWCPSISRYRTPVLIACLLVSEAVRIHIPRMSTDHGADWLRRLADLNFNVFELAEKTNERPLQFLAKAVLQNTGVLDKVCLKVCVGRVPTSGLNAGPVLTVQRARVEAGQLPARRRQGVQGGEPVPQRVPRRGRDADPVLFPVHAGRRAVPGRSRDHRRYHCCDHSRFHASRCVW